MGIHPYNLPELAHSQTVLIATMTKTKIHLVTFIQKLILLVYKDARGYQFEAISSNGNIYRHSEIYYSASSAEAKGRLWIKALMSEEF